MFFRNLTLFRYAPHAGESLKGLEEALESHRLRSPGPLEMSTRGAVVPLGDAQQPLVYQVQNCVLACVGSEDKLLPASIVNQELAMRIQAINEEQARPVTGRERKKLKAMVLEELLPRAFARPSKLHLYADQEHGWLVFDSSSRKACENALSSIREALGSFPAVPLAPEKSPRQILTEWLRSGDLPAGLELADECELRDPDSKGGAVIRCRHQDLASNEIQEHLNNGKEVFQLGLSFNDRLGFVLGEDLVIRKLRFFDDVLDELEDESSDSAQMEAETQFTLMALEIRQLLQALSDWFELSRPES